MSGPARGAGAGAMIDYIIAARDAARTLPATIGSVVAQTRGDWSCVIVDDGSTDGTFAAALRARDPRIIAARQRPAGPGAARNRGLALGGAPYVCFLDADDLVAPGHAAAMLAGIGGGFDAIASAYRFIGEDGEELGWPVAIAPGDSGLERLLEFNPFATGAVVLDRALVERLGGFDTACGHEDWDLMLRLARAGARWALPRAEELFLYRLGRSSRTTRLREQWASGLALLDRHAPAGSGVGPARRWTLRALARAIAHGDEGFARELRAGLGGLGAEDAHVLAGALAWAFPRAACVPPDRSPARASAWEARVRGALGGAGEAVLGALRLAWMDWDAIAAAALDRLGAGRRLVVYGMGRNGRRLARALLARGIEPAYIDDASAAAGMERLGVGDLGPRDAVIVTPMERSAILARLAGTAAVVWLPEDLTREGALRVGA